MFIRFEKLFFVSYNPCKLIDLFAVQLFLIIVHYSIFVLCSGMKVKPY